MTRWLRVIAAALLTPLVAVLTACGVEAPLRSTAAAGPAPAAPVAHAARHAASPRVRYARVALSVPGGNGGPPLNVRRTLILPRGWRAEVWARVPLPRLEAWSPEGDLLVSSPDNGRVFELVPGTSPSAPPTERELVSGLTNPQGLAFDRLNGHEVLYVAESDQLDRYAWTGNSLGGRTVVAGNLPDAGPASADVHRLKNVVVGRNHTIYVDIGSASNASPPGRSSPPRASVISYRPSGSGMRVLATGIRNGDGLSFAPDGTLWTAVNERDDITYPFHRSYHGTVNAYGDWLQAYVDDHPPDELARLTPGRNLGWPYCDPDPDLRPGHFGSAQSFANMPYDRDVQTNPTGRRLNCAKLPRIQRGIPAHSAPLGFHFLEGSTLPKPWSQGAVVGVHGSWDRVPPRAPGVLWLPWESRARTLGAAITLVGGFQSPSGQRWGRPVDAVPGPDGALYVSDDQANAIYRLVPPR
jgi:glucose/arabinose dehydrogenase